MKKFIPCLWFDSQAEEAANFYVSIFPNSKITQVEKYLSENPGGKPIGSVLTVNFEINGYEFLALNGGSIFKITEAISFIINCKDQADIDYYYEKLSHYPESEYCGWIKDKYGVSWQLIPEDYDQIIKSLSEDKKIKMMDTLMNMRRIDIKKLYSSVN